MTKGLKEGEPNGRDVYPDIIDHPHWQSPTRPHMSLYDRAAQFSSFDALSGYSDMIEEEQRLTDQRIELSEPEQERLNQKLSLINAAIRAGAHDGDPPILTITYFVPDPLKSRGHYETVTKAIRKIDASRGKLILMRRNGYNNQNIEINIQDILDIDGELVHDLDDAID